VSKEREQDMTPEDNKTDARKFNFYEVVRINADQDNWGHDIRQEIIGKEGVIFGIDQYDDKMKYFVYIRDLDKTYGVNGVNLEGLGQCETIEALLPEFSEHFFDGFSYCMGYGRMAEDPRFFAKFRSCMDQVERIYPLKAISLCIEYALNNIEEVNKRFFVHNNYSDDVVLEYVQRYRDSIRDI
jgi:hypothetical protein